MTIKTLESIDRFDLEQEIMNCWHVTDDINSLLEAYLDGPEMSKDDVANVLLGIKTLYHFKFDKLFSTFEQCIKNEKFNDQ